MKFCKKCSTEKPLSEFYNSSFTKDGKQTKCIACSRSHNAAWHQKNKQKRRESDQTRYARPGVRERYLEQHTSRRERVEFRARLLVTAARKRIPDDFSVDLSKVIEAIENGKCAVTGLQFDLRGQESRRSGRRCNPFAPSLDRIDSRNGYTSENTRVVVWQYNHMKGELLDADLLQFCRRIVEVGVQC